MVEEMRWKKVVAEYFPMKTSDNEGELALVDCMIDGEDLRATVRLIRWDVDGDQRMIRDIKEQYVNIGRAEHLEYLERYRKFLEALSTVFTDLTGDSCDELMPTDLFPSDVLDLKASTFDEFGRALTQQSRLGKYLN